MSKVPFDIKYRPQIESGEYKVETRSGKTARVVCWDRVGAQLIVLIGKDEDVLTYNLDGTTGQQMSLPSDLFIVTPEEEMSEFEKAFDRIAFEYCHSEIEDEVESVKKSASELLALAREQLIKDGYVIEKKAFHDAVEKIDPEEMKDVSENIDIANFIHNLGERYPEVSFAKLTRIAKAAYDFGKAEAMKDLQENLANNDIYRVPEWLREVLVMAKENGKKEALKDLPRWKLYRSGTEIDPLAVVRFKEGTIGRARYAVDDCYVLDVKDLLKLPGFKED